MRGEDCSQYPTQEEAYKREKQLKGWSRSKKEKLISGEWVKQYKSQMELYLSWLDKTGIRVAHYYTELPKPEELQEIIQRQIQFSKQNAPQLPE